MPWFWRLLVRRLKTSACVSDESKLDTADAAASAALISAPAAISAALGAQSVATFPRSTLHPHTSTTPTFDAWMPK